MDTCICTAESHHCPPETITILFIGYTPTQNKKLKKILLWKINKVLKRINKLDLVLI